MPVPSYKIQIVDDHEMMRVGLKFAAAQSSALTLAWLESNTLSDALDTYRRHEDIALVLLDLNLPDSKGLQSLHDFQSEFPQAKVAIFSATEDQFVVRQALAMGALGLVPKSGAATATVRLIEALLALTPPGAEAAVSCLPNRLARGAGGRVTETLNATQLKVLQLLLAGMNNQEVAVECHLALGTVKNTVSSILLAFDVNSRAHLISLFR